MICGHARRHALPALHRPGLRTAGLWSSDHLHGLLLLGSSCLFYPQRAFNRIAGTAISDLPRPSCPFHDFFSVLRMSWVGKSGPWSWNAAQPPLSPRVLIASFLRMPRRVHLPCTPRGLHGVVKTSSRRNPLLVRDFLERYFQRFIFRYLQPAVLSSFRILLSAQRLPVMHGYCCPSFPDSSIWNCFLLPGGQQHTPVPCVEHHNRVSFAS